jgi:molecular chaperone DnaK
MITDAEKYADEDRKRKEAVEVRNQGDSLVYSTEKFLSENGDKIPADVKSTVEADVAELKTALESDNVEAIAAATSKLGTSSQSMGAAMYANAAAADGGPSASNGSATPEDEGIVDAEIVDEDSQDASANAEARDGQ